MALTDIEIKNVKGPAKLTDGRGLYLLVTESDSKLWRYNYRFAGKQKTLAIGQYPDVKLAEARRKHEDARRELEKGVDPNAKRREEKTKTKVAAANTFGLIVDEYLGNIEEDLQKGEAAQRTLDKNTWLLKNLAAPLANRPITEITSPEILAICHQVERSGRRETAHRLRGTLGTVFRYAIRTGRAQIDPTLALKGKGVLKKVMVTNRPAITDAKRFGALLQVIDEYDGWVTLTAALKLSALTFPRPVEIRLMRVKDLDLDSAVPVWTIPAEIIKTRDRRPIPHEVPLSRQAVAVLRDILEYSGGYGGLVFPSIRSFKKPLSDAAFNAALRRMGVAQDEHCAHGFRSSASTLLNGARDESRPELPRFDHRVIDVQLNHMPKDENEVSLIYNRAKYWPERVALMQAWADMCDEMKTPKKRRNNDDLN